MNRIDYNQSDIRKAILSLGLKKGDVVFSHSNIAYFGKPEGGLSAENIKALFLDTILDIIGKEGTFIVPAFSYTFPNRGVFDRATTPSVCGTLSEIVRQQPGVLRSDDPLFSVVAVGRQAEELTQNVSEECFGENSFWDRFYRNYGLILNFNFGAANTYFHYVEQSLKVDYRYRKYFFCKIKKDSAVVVRPTVYFCRDMSNDLYECDWMGIDRFARVKGVIHCADVGRGYISLAAAQDLFQLIRKTLNKAPYFLTKARDVSPKPPLIRERKRMPKLLAESIPSYQWMEALRDIPRDVVSDGLNALFKMLKKESALSIEEYRTGARLGNWIVPEKWTCFEGHIKSLEGKEILSYEKDLSCVASYSGSFEGIVSRGELFRHLWTNPAKPDQVPSKNLYYDMDWGFCCSEQKKELITEDAYRITIKSELSLDTLKIGEIIRPGKSEETVLLCLHLSDQYVANDGWLSLQAGLEIWMRLRQIEELYYTYRLLVLPQTFNLSTYLQSCPPKKIKGIIVIDGGGSFLQPPGVSFADRFSWGSDTNAIFYLSKVMAAGNSDESWDRKVFRIKEAAFQIIDPWEPRCLAQK